MTDARDELEKKLKSEFDLIQSEAKSILEKTEASIKENPVTSVLIAAGIGFLVGMIVTRK